MGVRSKHRLSLSLPSDREIVLIRSFDAPRTLVFDAWTQPEHLRHWWGGCEETDLSTCEIDLREGGAWHFVVRGPAGQLFPFRGVYRQIVRPERLVHTMVFDVEPFSNSEALVTALFTEHAGQTTVTETTRHPSRESRDAHLQSGLEAGAASALDRLEALLVRLS